MENRTTLDKMKHATYKAVQENRLSNDDLVEFCNFVIDFLNPESLSDAAKRKGVSVQAISKHKEVKLIGGKKFYCENS